MVSYFQLALKELNKQNKNGARREFLSTLSNAHYPMYLEILKVGQEIIGLQPFTTRLGIESYFGRKLNLPANAIAAQTSGANTFLSKRDCRLCLQDADKMRRKTVFFALTPYAMLDVNSYRHYATHWYLEILKVGPEITGLWPSLSPAQRSNHTLVGN